MKKKAFRSIQVTMKSMEPLLGILTLQGLDILWNLADQVVLENQEEITLVETLIDQADHDVVHLREEDLGLWEATLQAKIH